MESDITGPVNIGNPGEMTIIEFAEIILRLTDSTSGIVHTDLPLDDPKVRQPDISFAREKLDWKPEVSLEEGIKKTIKYFRERE